MAQDNDQRNVYMSVDFGGIPTALRDTTLSGYIVKRGQNFKTERRRYFVLEGVYLCAVEVASTVVLTSWRVCAGGLLKYYNKHVKATGRGDGLKGQVGLCGMSIIRTDEVDSRDGCRWYTLKSPVEKDGRWLKFENDDLAEEWIKALQSAIYGTNHDALVRLPRTDIPAEVSVRGVACHVTSYGCDV